MHTTSASLLDRLRQPSPGKAWERFANLYLPLFFFWAGRLGLQGQDADDLVQEVFVKLLQELPSFNYDEKKSFRSWLRTVTLNTWRNSLRRRTLPLDSIYDASLSEVSCPDGTDAYAEAEYRKYLTARALQLIQSTFETTTWKAFWETAVCGRVAKEVARELGLSVGAVYTARARVSQRLREEFGDLLDS